MKQQKSGNLGKMFSTAAVAIVAATFTTQGSVLMSDSFNYANGDLTTVSGGLWAGHSSAGMNPVQVLDGEAIINQMGGQEDASRLVGSTMSPGDIWYASFSITVEGNETSTPVSNYLYFAHFKPSGSSYASRVALVALDGSDFTFNIVSTSGSVGTSWATGFTYGSTHTIVHSYNFGTGESRMWVDPTSFDSPSVAHAGSFTGGFAQSGYAFRQTTGNTVENIDDLVIGTTFNDVMPVPEPSSVALLILGAGGVLLFLRKRKRSYASVG
jgi:hypothetical protein